MRDIHGWCTHQLLLLDMTDVYSVKYHLLLSTPVREGGSILGIRKVESDKYSQLVHPLASLFAHDSCLQCQVSFIAKYGGGILDVLCPNVCGRLEQVPFLKGTPI